VTVGILLVVAQCTCAQMLLLANADVYTPNPIGTMDILIGGKKILAIYPSTLSHVREGFAPLKRQGLLQEINVNQAIVLPGLIDPHVHVSGGGGESGPNSRTPNSQLSQLIDAGITTLVGLRGTDGITRSAENVLQFLYSLAEGGLTTYMWTGSYHVPVNTLTSTVERDIILIEKIIGAGEIAISDHRSSWPSYQQLVELVSNCRVAGMLGGKAGIAYFHVGSAPTKLDPLWEIVNKTTIPITNMYPTHMSSRGPALIKEGQLWISAGGVLDFTADAPNETATTLALLDYFYQGVNMTRVTLSSDAYGSNPTYDNNGNIIAYSVCSPENLINQIRTMILYHGWSIEQAFSLATSNTAAYLGFSQKGTLAVDKDADVIVLDPTTLDLQYVISNGYLVKTPNATETAMFPCM